MRRCLGLGLQSYLTHFTSIKHLEKAVPGHKVGPLAPSRGHLIDHVGLSVLDLNAWIEKLQSEGVTFLRQPYKIGDARAVMIEGPSHEAIELVEVK